MGTNLIGALLVSAGSLTLALRPGPQVMGGPAPFSYVTDVIVGWSSASASTSSGASHELAATGEGS